MPESLYSLSVGTEQKARLFNSGEKRGLILHALFEQGARLGWSFEAWAVLENHYHFVGKAPDSELSLERLLRSVNSITARELNRLDGTPGRTVWYQYWDTCITNEPSYFARLKYVHENPVKHGLVKNAMHYPWCSMRWLLEQQGEGTARVLAAKTDTVTIYDDF